MLDAPRAPILFLTGLMTSQEMHPYLPQIAYVASHKVLGIEVTAYSPLAHAPNDGVFPPPLIKNEVLVDVAETYVYPISS